MSEMSQYIERCTRKYDGFHVYAKKGLSCHGRDWVCPVYSGQGRRACTDDYVDHTTICELSSVVMRRTGEEDKNLTAMSLADMIAGTGDILMRAYDKEETEDYAYQPVPRNIMISPCDTYMVHGKLVGFVQVIFDDTDLDEDPGEDEKEK